LGAEALESSRVFLHMYFDGYKPFVDKSGNSRIGINLGIQPGASPSHWGGAEIQKHGTVLLFPLCQAGVHIGFP
jgi:hypothetical protein